MLSIDTIKEISIKFQTAEINIIREYFQHLFLQYLYQREDAEKIFFKGGTALRFVYNSPRFSEGLDFSCSLTQYKLKNLITETVEKISSEYFRVSIEELKPTSGGYFGILSTEIYNYSVKIELNISLRDEKPKGEPVLISSPLVLPYTLIILNEEELIKEKINALLTRAKPRDYFDLYFINKKPHWCKPNSYIPG